MFTQVSSFFNQSKAALKGNKGAVTKSWCQSFSCGTKIPHADLSVTGQTTAFVMHGTGISV